MATKFYNTQKNVDIRRKLRKEMPIGESRMWVILKNRNLGYKFRRQYGIGRFVVDFCCPEIKLIIEVDGLSHENKEVIQYDQKRQSYLESRGFTVIRFPSAEAFSDMQDAAKKIADICKKLDKT